MKRKIRLEVRQAQSLKSLIEENKNLEFLVRSQISMQIFSLILNKKVSLPFTLSMILDKQLKPVKERDRSLYSYQTKYINPLINLHLIKKIKRGKRTFYDIPHEFPTWFLSSVCKLYNLPISNSSIYFLNQLYHNKIIREVIFDIEKQRFSFIYHKRKHTERYSILDFLSLQEIKGTDNEKRKRRSVKRIAVIFPKNRLLHLYTSIFLFHIFTFPLLFFFFFLHTLVKLPKKQRSRILPLPNLILDYRGKSILFKGKLKLSESWQFLKTAKAIHKDCNKKEIDELIRVAKELYYLFAFNQLNRIELQKVINSSKTTKIIISSIIPVKSPKFILKNA
ncbi:MAG: hypothetical protein ACTSP3_12560 [Candidatus Heimdallarchaeaceae archaeon]